MSDTTVPNVDEYAALIPAYNAVRPKFMATLQSLLTPVVDLQSFIQELPQQFDLDIAIGTQLDQVGIWIGRSRFVEVPIVGVFFSWDIGGLGWEQGTWQGTFDPGEGTQTLDDQTYRQLLYAKVAANKWDGTSRGIVDAVTKLFGDMPVNVRVLDNQDMTMVVEVIGGVSSLIFRSLLLGGYVPIKPVGVHLDYALLDSPPIAGLVNATMAVHGQGTLAAAAQQNTQITLAVQGQGTVRHTWTPGNLFTIASQPVFGTGTVGVNAGAVIRIVPVPVQVQGTVTINSVVVRPISTVAVAGLGTVGISVPATVTRITNWIRNPRGEGAVVGTPGTDPTNWIITDNFGQEPGMTKQIVGQGTDGGIPYTDVRFFGSSSNFISWWDIMFDGEVVGSSGIVNGGHWSVGAYMKQQGGSLTGVNQFQIGFYSYHSQSYNNVYDSQNLFVTNAALSSQFKTWSDTIVDPVVDQLAPRMSLEIAANTNVDITVRVGGAKFVNDTAIDGTLILPRAGFIPSLGQGTTFVY